MRLIILSLLIVLQVPSQPPVMTLSIQEFDYIDQLLILQLKNQIGTVNETTLEKSRAILRASVKESMLFRVEER